MAFRVAFLGIDHPHGAGWRQLLDNLEGRLEIVAVMPGYGGTTCSLEEKYAGAFRGETVEELIAFGEFDGAVVCLPNDEGPAAAARLAAAGKHLLLEKPGAASAADLQPLVDAATATGIAFQAGYMWRYDDLANRLRAMAAEGRFGKLISIEMLYATSDVKRRDPDHYLFNAQQSGGGFFNWLACHYLDLLTYITGQQVAAVTARVGVFGAVDCEVEDGGTAILELSGGALATFVGGYWIPRWQGENRWTFRGSERWVHWDPSLKDTQGSLEIHGPMPQWNAMDETYIAPGDSTPGYGGGRGLALVEDWLSAAQTGDVCRNTLQSVQSTLAVIDAIYESSRSGQRVVVDSSPSR
ncbi:Gfo/Idh/MocA family protein [Lignipirellula cremea]|uniref:Glucose--fructose oxidoreductase n=1 Tax=Lignipirellula cremea TaxID=2528010 RepID=A0A518DT36_9BACT|nr:Gfo/Idh/MocA family oxidoreductase [Lignipirellula cremea]QDU95011.1 Glucose--fructose oxidoreductase precursor [Lignipirellula cremea]